MSTLPKRAQRTKEVKLETCIKLLMQKNKLVKDIEEIDEEIVVLKDAIGELDKLQKLFKKDW